MIPVVKTLEMLYFLQNHEEGEIVHVSDLGQDFCYNEGEWIPYYAEEEIVVDGTEAAPEMNLYSLNKVFMAQMPDLLSEDIEKAKQTIRRFINENLANVYMMLCHDLRYYTIFLKNDNYEEKMEDVIIECLEHFGAIKSIDYNEETRAVELWFTYEDEPYVAYLFNYDEGVVLCQ